MSIQNTHYSQEEINCWFNKANKIYFIGIGGVSMSSLARFSSQLGKEVHGYDKERSDITKELEKIAKIKYYSTPDSVRGMDMVIYTNAIDEKNAEYRQAKREKIPLISRANFLGYIISLHKYKIGVSGTHGKSTVTAMLCHIFDYAYKNPTCFCGANMLAYKRGYKAGGREYCIYEACEYLDSFLSLPTTDAVVLNIDRDHPDYFSSVEDIKCSFKKYIKDAERVYICCDCEGARELTHKSIIAYGLRDNASYRAKIENPSKNTEKSHTGVTFSVYKRKELLTKCHIPQYGTHMVQNALGAFAVAHTHGISPSVIGEALSTFSGVGKRLELIKKTDTGADIFEDYAHHPKEIECTLNALSDMGYKRILCIFQPHTYSRTYFLYKEFTSCFSLAKELVIHSVFPAREENIYELSEEAFAIDCGGRLETDIREIANKIKHTDADCVAILGAGDLSRKLRELL